MRRRVDLRYAIVAIVRIQVAVLDFIMVPNHKNSDVGNSDMPKSSSKEFCFFFKLRIESF